jgi:hypothetical protein
LPCSAFISSMFLSKGSIKESLLILSGIIYL